MKLKRYFVKLLGGKSRAGNVNLGERKKKSKKQYVASTLGKWEKGKLNPQEAEEKKQYLEQKIGETETRKSTEINQQSKI